tara:strand:+ start:538 stop:720 length:183 start_codon:yes stop_codon:yes gene_type:complete
MIITNAQYHQYPDAPERGNISILATIDGQSMSVPLDPDNRHYAEILKQVEEGTLTIKDAD